MLMFPLSSEVIRKYWQAETTQFWCLGEARNEPEGCWLEGCFGPFFSLHRGGDIKWLLNTC